MVEIEQSQSRANRTEKANHLHGRVFHKLVDVYQAFTRPKKICSQADDV